MDSNNESRCLVNETTDPILGYSGSATLHEGSLYFPLLMNIDEPYLVIANPKENDSFRGDLTVDESKALIKSLTIQ